MLLLLVFSFVAPGILLRIESLPIHRLFAVGSRGLLRRRGISGVGNRSFVRNERELHKAYSKTSVVLTIDVQRSRAGRRRRIELDGPLGPIESEIDFISGQRRCRRECLGLSADLDPNWTSGIRAGRQTCQFQSKRLWKRLEKSERYGVCKIGVTPAAPVLDVLQPLNLNHGIRKLPLPEIDNRHLFVGRYRWPFGAGRCRVVRISYFARYQPELHEPYSQTSVVLTAGVQR